MKKYQEAMEELKKEGIRPSYIRVRILDYLMESRIHPTVDEIYENLGKEIATLSKTTVYNSLKILQEKSLIHGLNIEGNEMRYEAVRGFHGHFKCDSCKSIYDIKISELDFIDDIEGFVIKDEQILITGLCPKCSN